MKKTLLCVLLCLMGCFFLSGCDFTKIPDPFGIMEPTQALYDGLDQLKPRGPQEKAQQPAQERYTIIVDDGSGMKGFVSPNCMSYRAVITALTSLSISSERACYRASEFLDSAAANGSEDEAFFQSAVQKQFFMPRTNNVAKVITAMTESYAEGPEQVMILVSDMMIPTEDDCILAAKALQEAIVIPANATMGIIGIQGEFRGSIENLPVSPITGQIRKISDYMVKEREASGNFRHPLYLLFMGDDQAVLSAMEQALTALNESGLLDEKASPETLYFAEYDVARNEKDDIFAEFNLGCQQYNLADYPAQFLVRGVADENDAVRYPAATEVPEPYQQLLSEVPIVKIYDLARGSAEKNVKIRCKIPYSLIDSSVYGASPQNRYGLFTPAEKLDLALEDYVVAAEIRVLEYNADGAKPQARWIAADSSIVSCESAVIDENRKKIDVVLNVNTDQLVKDEPLLCSVGVRVGIQPAREEFEKRYNTDWIKDWTLNIKEYDQESIIYGKVESSARFTCVTTGHTPFLSNLICGGIAEQQVSSLINNLSERTDACVQTTMFGMIVRDVPNRYLGGSTWAEEEDFYGWAFSVEDAMQIRSVFR
jgi:hypothetical protein